jgi:uncharacterized membrane protein YozB (DUF420 family)
MSAFTYEIGVMAFLVVGLISLSSIGSFNVFRTIKMNFYNIAFFLLYGCVNWYARLHKTSSYGGIELGQWRYFLRGFFVQLFGTFPATYALTIDVPKIMHSWFTIFSNETFIISSLGIFVFISTTLFFSKSTWVSLSRHNRTVLFIVSSIFVILPCASMGISKDYQQNQVLGMAYLPVYFSYFGLAIALGMVFLFIMTRGRQKSRLATVTLLSLFVSVFGGFHAYYNSRVFDFIENNTAYERDAVFESLKVGLMKDLHEDSVVISKIGMLYDEHDKIRSLAATILDNPPYFLFANKLGTSPITPYEKKTFYLLEGEVHPKNGAWLTLTRFELTDDEKRDVAHVDLCQKRGKYVRVINLISGNYDNKRVFSFQSEHRSYVIDTVKLQKQPISGNILRSLFNQKRLNSEYQIVELSSGQLTPCSMRVEEI